MARSGRLSAGQHDDCSISTHVSVSTMQLAESHHSGDTKILDVQ